MPDTETEDTRAPEEIQRSIATRRRDLIESVHELEGIVREKLDVKAHVRRFAERAMVRAGTIFENLVERVREKPVPFMVLGGVMVLMLFRRRKPRGFSYTIQRSPRHS